MGLLRKIVVLVFAVIMCLANYNVTRMGNGLWGTNDFVEDADSLFITTGGCRVSVLSFDEYGDPVEKSHIYTEFLPTDLKVHGNRVFVATRFGINMYDISLPSNIRFVSQWLSPNYINCIAPLIISSEGPTPPTFNEIVFAATNNRYLFSVDFTDSMNPTEISREAIYLNVCEMDADDEFVYMGCGTSGLAIVDVSRPDSMFLTGGSPAVNEAHGVQIDGNTLYLADYYYGLLIYDVYNRSSPDGMGSFDSPGFCERVTGGGDHVFLADHFPGMRIVDVSNPMLPHESDFEDPLGRVVDVAVIDTIAMMANSVLGPQFVRIDDDSMSGGIFAEFDMPEGGLDCVTWDTYCFTAARDYGVCIMYLPDSGDASVMYHLDTPGTAQSITIRDRELFVADGSGGMRIMHIDTYGAISEWGWTDTPGSARKIVVQDTFAFIADGSDGLWSASIANYEDPYLIANFHTDNGYSVAVRDTIAYLGDGTAGLKIVSIARPDSMYLLGQTNTWDVLDIELDYPYAFIAAGSADLVILDISDPLAIAHVSSVSVQGSAEAICLYYNMCYVAALGLSVVDVSDVTAPWLAGFYLVDGTAKGVWTDSLRTILATEENGLHFLRYEPSAPLGWAIEGGDSLHLWPDTVETRGGMAYTDRIRIWNRDTVACQVGFSISSESWQYANPIPESYTPGIDTVPPPNLMDGFSLSAIFSPTMPDTSAFSAPTCLLVPGSIGWATPGSFGWTADSLMPGDTTSLWLQIHTPLYYSTRSAVLDLGIYYRMLLR